MRNYFDNIDGLNAGTTADFDRALAIALRKLALGTLLQPPYGGHDDAHGAATIRGPHERSSRLVCRFRSWHTLAAASNGSRQ